MTKIAAPFNRTDLIELLADSRPVSGASARARDNGTTSAQNNDFSAERIERRDRLVEERHTRNPQSDRVRHARWPAAGRS
jgi:hypothetical protein